MVTNSVVAFKEYCIIIKNPNYDNCGNKAELFSKACMKHQDNFVCMTREQIEKNSCDIHIKK